METTAARIEDRLKELSAEADGNVFRVTCSPLVGLHLIGEGGTEIDLLEEELGLELHARCSSEMDPERFVIKGGPPDGLRDDGLPFGDGETITIEPENVLDIPSQGLMAVVKGCIVYVPDAPHVIDQALSVRLAEVDRSYVRGTVVKRKSRRSRKRSPRRRSRRKKKAQAKPADSAAEK